MLNTYKQGLISFSYLCNFKDYRTSEIILKILFLPIAVPLFTLFVITGLFFYTIERLVSPFFKRFLVFQMKMIQVRNTASDWGRRGYGLLTFITTILFLPFLVLYYASMLLKALSKMFMRSMILHLDFSVQFNRASLQVLDDKDRMQSPFSSMMHDAQQNQAFSKALEDYINTHPDINQEELMNGDFVDEVDETKNNK